MRSCTGTTGRFESTCQMGISVGEFVQIIMIIKYNCNHDVMFMSQKECLRQALVAAGAGRTHGEGWAAGRACEHRLGLSGQGPGRAGSPRSGTSLRVGAGCGSVLGGGWWQTCLIRWGVLVYVFKDQGEWARGWQGRGGGITLHSTEASRG